MLILFKHLLRLDFLANTALEIKHLILSFQYALKHTYSMKSQGLRISESTDSCRAESIDSCRAEGQRKQLSPSLRSFVWV